MDYDIEIEDGSRRIGSLTIVKNPERLDGARTASGFEIQVPVTLTLRARPKVEPMLMVNNLRGKVFFQGENGPLLNVGYLVHDDSHIAGTNEEGSNHSTEIRLEWRGSFTDIAYIEKVRNGQSPALLMRLECEWSFLMCNEATPFRIPTDTQRAASRYGNIKVPYPREVWIDLVRKLGIAENVFIEVPLPTSPPEPWSGVWSALVDARNAFEQGGSSGWQGTVTSVRLALERWRAIEKEEPGAGWKAPSPADRESRSKKERLDALRWHLMQIAHLGPHSGAEESSRDDALLMLSTLSGLLAVRKP